MGVLDDTYDGVRCVVGVLFYDVAGGVGGSMGNVTMGEFKKRVNDLFNRTPYVNYPNDKGDRTTVNSWIEEAKKEFPRFDISPFAPNALHSNEGVGLFVSRKNMVKIYGWFEKWFGGEGK